MLKRYFLIWIAAAVVAAGLGFVWTGITSSNSHKELTALVSFTFDGIEKGLDPSGNTFDINTLKTPTIIEAALTDLNEPLDQLENIRQNISFQGYIPDDAIDRITVYKSIYEGSSSGALTAAQEMLDTDYYPTQFTVYFNYSATDFSAKKAAEFLNTMLECYRSYFIETYGYNSALGSAVSALDYTDYDYAEAIDVFSNSLTTLNRYVTNLANNDSLRFRSNETGYTFADLSEAINTLSSIDLDIISSYITVNNVTKDKDALIDYYQYRIDALTREKTVAQEQLESITESIENYEKDTILIFGNGTDNTDTSYSVSSEAYNELITKKLEVQNELSTDIQLINFYNQRITALKGKNAASDENIAKVEEDLASLNEKVNTLIESVNKTANEYYETVSYSNAYNILVPASASSVSEIKHLINDSIQIIMILEVLIIVVYIAFVFIQALIFQNKKRIASATTETAGTDNDDESSETDNSAKKN